MKNKILKTLIITASLTTLMSTASFAAGWMQDAKGWWYQNEDGSYPKSTWQWIDGNNDGFCECYGFNSEGYLYVNTTTSDGFMVDKNGAWTTGNTPYIKKIINTNTNSKNTISEGNSSYNRENDENNLLRVLTKHFKKIQDEDNE